jgi:hypothetical protein
MIRNAKMLGLAIVAALALTAVMASVASATNFTAASYPVKITGSQSSNHVFTVTGGTVSCTTATFSGELTGASESMTVIPFYDGCTAFGFINSSVTGFGSAKCDYKFFTSGATNLECAAGDVQIDAGTCTVTMQAGNNQGLKTNTYTNTPTDKVTVDTQVTGIHTTVTSGFGCPISGGTHTNASYTGTTVVEGKNSKGTAVAIDVN